MATAHTRPHDEALTGTSTPKKTRAPRGGGTVFPGKSHGRDCWIAKITVTDREGRKVEIRGVGATRQQAVERRTANLAKRLGSTGITSTPRVHTISSYMPIWLDSYGADELKAQSRRQHENNLKKWVLPYIDLPLNKLTEEVLELHFTKTLPDTLKAGPSARVNAHKSLRALLRHAVLKGKVIPTNPLAGVKLKPVEAKVDIEDREHISKRVSIVRGLLRWLSDPACPHHEHYLLVLIMLIGLRRGETLGITWDCLHQMGSKDATLTVKQQLMYVPGEGYFIQPSTKNKKSRHILLPAVWKNALLARKKEARQANEAWAEDLIFLQPNGRHIDYNTYNEIWRTVLRDYMLKDGNRKLHSTDYWRPHSNRKVFATLLGETGVPVNVAASLLGHSSEAMTFYYMGVTNAAKQQGMEGLSKRLGL